MFVFLDLCLYGAGAGPPFSGCYFFYFFRVFCLAWLASRVSTSVVCRMSLEGLCVAVRALWGRGRGEIFSYYIMSADGIVATLFLLIFWKV